MAKIRIDQKLFEVPDGGNFLEACLKLGINLPYFCWHPALGSVGACRQCAVKQYKDEKDTHGKLVMACVTPVRDGARISVEDPEAQAFRRSIIEWLMLNHPHDCPVCDEGGECHLQDMTVMTGHTYRRNRFKKRTYRNQNLGPFVNHEMNRCIACYRCVRFYKDYAGGRDLDVFASHDHVYFGRAEDGVLENEFSGNLVEVCPTGVFTDKTLKKHYTRKWDLQTAPSVCSHCSLGCNTIPGERYGTLRRIRNRYHPDVNGYFLCDRGRYGYEYANGEKRIRDIWVRGARKTQSEGIEALRTLLGRPTRVIGIGSPRASLESNFALKALVGPDRFFSGFSEQEGRLHAQVLGLMRCFRPASIREIEESDAILVVGEDLTNTAPRLALALRQAVRNEPMQTVHALKIPTWQDASVRDVLQTDRGPLFVATSYRTKLAEISRREYLAAPDDLARLGFAIAHALDPSAPEVGDFSETTLANEIAQALKSARRPAIISGVSSGSEAILQAVGNIAAALSRQGREPRISLVAGECNSIGAALLGGQDLEQAFERAREIDTVIVLENDLYRRTEAEKLEAFLKAVPNLVVIDSIATGLVPRAQVIFPASSFAEGSGTWISAEGRAQRFFRVFEPQNPARESWRWLAELTDVARWRSLDGMIAAMVEAEPELRGSERSAPGAEFRIHDERIPRQTHRVTGRTAVHANVTVHEPKPPEDMDTPFAFSMEGYDGLPPAALIPRFWSPGWNSVQSLNRLAHHESAGARLFEGGASIEFASRIPPAFRAEEGRWLTIPIAHLFGTEETSSLAPAISGRAPAPYLVLNPADAPELREGEEVALDLLPGVRGLRLRLDASLPRGVIGVPFGLRGIAGPARLLLCSIEGRKARGAA